MTKKIRIMHIINNLEIGGAERILVDIANEMSKRDDVEVIVVSLEGHGSLSKELSDKVILKEFKYKLFLGPILNRLDMHIRSGLLSYVKKMNPDIIHGHLIKGEDFAKALGMLLKKPVVITAHDSITHHDRRSKMLNKYLSSAIAVSEDVKKYLMTESGISESKIVVIPNSVDTSRFSGSIKKFDINNPVFIYVGRILESKGIEDAIAGLSKLKKDYPNIQFLIYGKPVFEEYKVKLDKLIKKNGYDFVKFMGKTSDVPSALKKGDIFVLPSQSEGFAICVLEAAASSKPVIATRTGAIPEIVSDGVSGLFVDWHNPEKIYKSAKKMLDNNLVEKFGKQARLIAISKYDIKKISEMYYDLYRKLIN